MKTFSVFSLLGKVMCLFGVVALALGVHSYLAATTRAHHSLPYILANAESVDIIPKGSGIEGGPSLGVSERYQAAMFASLKASTHSHTTALPHAKQDYLFLFNRPAKTIEEESPGYWYDIQTGELGRDKEWYIVPHSFKLWMQAAKIKAPRQSPYIIKRRNGLTIITPPVPKPD